MNLGVVCLSCTPTSTFSRWSIVLLTYLIDNVPFIIVEDAGMDLEETPILILAAFELPKP